MKTFQMLVALGPALACSLLAIVAHGPPMARKALQESLQTPETLEHWRDNLTNAAWVGTAAAALFTSESSKLFWVAAGVWFFVMQALAGAVNRRLVKHRLIEAELAMGAMAQQHRKMAGAMRSIVKDELAKALVGKP